MSSALKSFVKRLYVYSGFYKILIKFKKEPRILFWHGIDKIKNEFIEAESFDFLIFKKQVSFLQQHFDIISIEEFYDRIVNDKFVGKEIVLTFDDGYLNNLKIVAPYLKKKNIPFSVYISTNHISEGKLFPTSIVRLIVLGSSVNKITLPYLGISRELSNYSDRESLCTLISKAIKNESIGNVTIILNELISNIDEREFLHLKNEYSSVVPMNWEDVIELSQYDNVTIGSHCKEHICCHNKQDKAEVKEQILESKRIIEGKLGKSCDFFAYPNGDYTDYSNKYVEEAGYLMGLSTKRIKLKKDFSQRFSMPRIGVPQNIVDFKLTLSLYPFKK